MAQLANDTEVILSALQKERDELHERIMQVDRIIKRVKSLDYSQDAPIQEPKQLKATNEAEKPLFPRVIDIKVQVMRVFDILKCVSTLKQLQTEYNRISGNTYNIRESVRTLHKSGLLKMMKERNANRGVMWVKSDWLDNGQLKDEYKTDGFDLLYQPSNLIYE